jgi:hypothetical protein
VLLIQKSTKIIMLKLSKKACLACGSIFQPRTEVHEYCCNACRTAGHRKRHAIEEPLFLKGASKPIVTTLKVVENVSVKSPNKFDAKPVIPPDFTDIGVTVYIANPAFVNSAKEYQICVENTAILEKKRQALKREIDKLNGRSSKAKGAIFGGVAAVSFALTKISKRKIVNPIVFIYLLPIAFVGGIIGKSLAAVAHFGSKKAQKLAEADEKEIELLQIEQQILISKGKEKDVKIERDAVQQQIARYDKISKDEDFVPYQDVTNQNAISLESLKNKKFKTLPFSDKWQDLIGTPEANFCMMVYGKPGQGKSYFTLELSEYLASNFGDVLFNSSEEGSSLSLQNKVVNLNPENIFLGRADDIKSLQFLLTQSPYKFVVIDSINHMNITPEDLRKLRGLHPTKGFICIFQSTKSGDFKGSNEYEHDADISIKIENRKAECMKTRYK